MTRVEYLDVEDLLRLTALLNAGPVRDLGLLDAAAHRPAATVFGVDAYQSLERKAAALMHSLVRTHPLVDGNKRLGWLSLVVFLDLNGVPLTVDDEGAFTLTMDVASGTADLDAIVRAITL